MSSIIESVTYTISGQWGSDFLNGFPAQVKFTVPFPATSSATPATQDDVDDWDDLAKTVANWGLANGWKGIDSIIREISTTEQTQGLTTSPISF